MTKTVKKDFYSAHFYQEKSLILERLINKESLWKRSWSNYTENFQNLAARKNEQQCLQLLQGKGAPTINSDEVSDNSIYLNSSLINQLSNLNLSLLSFQQKLLIARAITKTLSEIHANHVFHFSLRPSCFLLDESLKKAELIDFGSAQVFPRDSSGISAFYPDNADQQFLAPEQSHLLGETVDSRTDLYSLGCVFVWLFTEQSPYFELQNDNEIGYAHVSRKINYRRQLKVPDCEGGKENLIVLLDGLLEKEPNQRYQSSIGVLCDIEAMLHTPDKILTPDRESKLLSERLHLPNKLYGREKETRLLKDAFTRVSQGPSEVILIAGYSGIGKSSLVEGIRQSVLISDGLYLSGKFDQYQRDVPYRAIQQALSQLIRHILSLPQEDLDFWKQKITDVLSPNAQVIIDILPELGELLGPQPALPQLGPEEQQNRFNRIFIDFIRVICTSYRPLVFFIDDLQWADMASIQLLHLLLSDQRSQYCLILGAYRDNEVDEKHPFNQMLMSLERKELRLQQLNLPPLSQQILQLICADTLRCSKDKVGRLSELIYEKTGGNPFFFRQFIQELYLRRLLEFDSEFKKWRWSTDQIRLQNITDNVVDLMTSKLKRLPEETKILLEQAACIGSSIEINMLDSLNNRDTKLKTLVLLRPALHTGLLVELLQKDVSKNSNHSVRFLHDRVQQAAYSQISESVRKETHLSIGKLLLEDVANDKAKKDDKCFEIVSHLNRVHDLLSVELKNTLIELNLLAAKKSKASTAYSTSISYLNQLFELASDKKNNNEAIFKEASIEKLESLYLSGSYEEAELYYSQLNSLDFSNEEKVHLHVILITQYTRFGELDRAIEQGVIALNEQHCYIKADMESLQQALYMAQKELQSTPFKELVNKEVISEENVIFTVNILMAMQPCCYNSGSMLFPMTILKLLELTHEHGNSAYSSYIYMMYGLLCTKVLKDYETAFEANHYSQLVSLNFDKNPLLEGRLSMMRSNFIMPWQRPLQKSAELREIAFQQCFEQGDYYWGVHAYIFGFYADLVCSSSVDSLLQNVEKVIGICLEIKQPAQVYLSCLQRNLLHIFQGRLDNTLTLDHEIGYEDKAYDFYDKTNYMCGKYDRLLGRLLQGYLFANYEQTLSVTLAKNLAQNELDEGIFHEAIYTQFNILSILALKQIKPSAITSHYQEWLEQALAKCQSWYDLNPYNFSCGYFLIKAELSILAGDQIKAFSWFEQSIQASAKAGFALYQAIANERAGIYRRKLNQNTLANGYIDQAKNLYSKWGAHAKSSELERNLIDNNHSPIRSVSQHFDWHSVLSASQEISQPLVLKELINQMLKQVTTMTGAQNVSLYKHREGCWQLSAFCEKGDINTSLDKEQLIPNSILYYTLNSQKIRVIKDASQDHEYMFDDYVLHKGVKSVLCLPLFVHDKLVGTLYLEHNETTNLFTEQKVQTMELLAGQFAISYQNATYFQKLEKHNEELEAAVEDRTLQLNLKNQHLEVILKAMPVPFGITMLDGSLIQGNSLLFDCLEISKDKVKAVNVNQFYVDKKDRKYMVAQLKKGDGVTEYECEMQTYLGKPFWALLSVTEITLDFGVGMFVTITDISDRKEKEKTLKHQALTDPLTGAQNRRAFIRNANKVRAREQHSPVYVAMLDIDHFKRLNDTYGHSAGDVVLKQFTKYVQAHLRENDIFGRLGGEEFGVILINIETNEAEFVVKRISKLVEKMTVIYEHQEIHFTVSIGLTSWRQKESLDNAQNRADSLLYEAKQKGRNRVVSDVFLKEKPSKN